MLVKVDASEYAYNEKLQRTVSFPVKPTVES